MKSNFGKFLDESREVCFSFVDEAINLYEANENETISDQEKRAINYACGFVGGAIIIETYKKYIYPLLKKSKIYLIISSISIILLLISFFVTWSNFNIQSFKFFTLFFFPALAGLLLSFLKALKVVVKSLYGERLANISMNSLYPSVLNSLSHQPHTAITGNSPTSKGGNFCF